MWQHLVRTNVSAFCGGACSAGGVGPRSSLTPVVPASHHYIVARTPAGGRCCPHESGWSGFPGPSFRSGLCGPCLRWTVCAVPHDPQSSLVCTSIATAPRRVLLTRHTSGLCVVRRFIQNTVCYSENRKAKQTTKSIVATSASLPQSMNIVHLNTNPSQGMRGTRLDQLKNATAEVHGAEIDGINAQCCLDTSVAWPSTSDGRYPPESLGHSQRDGRSRHGAAATDIVHGPGGGGGKQKPPKPRGYSLRTRPTLGTNELAPTPFRGYSQGTSPIVRQLSRTWPHSQDDSLSFHNGGNTRTAHRALCEISGIFQVGRDPVASGVNIQQRTPLLYLPTNRTVVVAAHTPLQLGPGTESTQRSGDAAIAPSGLLAFTMCTRTKSAKRM